MRRLSRLSASLVLLSRRLMCGFWWCVRWRGRRREGALVLARPLLYGARRRWRAFCRPVIVALTENEVVEGVTTAFVSVQAFLCLVGHGGGGFFRSIGSAKGRAQAPFVSWCRALTAFGRPSLPSFPSPPAAAIYHRKLLSPPPPLLVR